MVDVTAEVIAVWIFWLHS